MALTHVREVPVDLGWFASEWRWHAVSPDVDARSGAQKKDRQTGAPVWRVVCAREDADGTLSFVKIRVAAEDCPQVRRGDPARLIGLVAHPMRLRSGVDILWLEATGVASDASDGQPRHVAVEVDDGEA